MNIYRQYNMFKSKEAKSKEAAAAAAKEAAAAAKAAADKAAEAIKTVKAPEEVKDSQTVAIRNFLEMYKEAQDIEKHFKK
jgi:hypothetical protein